jgi:sialate O-acetylesterase
MAAALSVALLGAGTTARAHIQMPAIFGSHMVLQRDQKDKVWGKAHPGDTITVAIAGQEKTATAGDDGAWSVMLDPMPAGGPHTMTVKGKDNTITFEDVLVGEVWICSGQSNMQWAVGQANDAELEIAAAKYPNIRLISVPQVGTQEPQWNFKGEWAACSPETVKDFSAVGYFFGRQLHQTLGVPIGLIDDAWGGSAAEAWVRRDILEKDGRFKGLMDRWTKIEQELGGPEAKARFEEQQARFREAAKAARAEGKPAPRPPQNPEGQLAGNARPGNIYNGVLRPTIGYGIRGAIWYQGESNAGRAYQYRDLFPLMIESWRKEWGQGDFPFYWVQLADFMAEKAEPGDSTWAELREAQTRTLTLPNTGEAVIVDLGEAQDIHPRNKQDVADRLARWALAKDYGVGINYRSPTYKAMAKQDGKIVLKIDHVGGGLKAFDVPELKGFTIAGGDRKFVKATAKLVGRDTIEVSAEGVTDPVAVRYAWADNPICNVYSVEGLPLTPFRTDDWKGITADAQ